MTQPDRCPECGAERSAGICPRCLIRLGIDGAGAGHSRPSSPVSPAGRTGGETTASGVLDAIAASIGPIPRVLLRDTAPGEQPGPIVRPQGGADADSSIRYRIDGEIARGGMGAILKGRDPDLGRDVALKVLRDDLRDDSAMVRRFVEEAQIGGQIQHPGVVPIYELGTFADRRPFFAMKLVKGHTLAQLLEARKGLDDDRPRFLSIFEAIAQTVAYAHARGVIHRDLKPSNVMVGAFGEVQVMDWGLARVLPRGGVADDEKASRAEPQETVIATAGSGPDAPRLSRPGSAMGTPAYMAPEQARGEVDRVDERADVFALGSILAEVLSGQPAFLGRSSAEILRKAALGDTADALARLAVCGGDAELVSIATDCLAREAEDRPRHAGGVAERVKAYLNGVQDRLRAAELARAAESARAEEAVARAAAERRARRFQVGLAASLLVLTTVGGLTFTYLLHQHQVRAARFDRELAEATTLRDRAREAAVDLALWQGAMAALEQAEGQGPEERVADLRGEIGEGLNRATRMARLRQELVETRANQQDIGADGTDAAYTAAFREAGMDLEALELTEFARRLGRWPEPVVVEVAAFLDDWSAARRAARRPVVAWRRPLEAARRADPDSYRDRLRTVLLAEDRRRESDALKALAAAPEVSRLPAPAAVLLGQALTGIGQPEEAVALLRTAAVRHPGDVWVAFYLAQALDGLRPSAREEAVRYYTAARALRPETSHELAHLLERMGHRAEAEAVFRELVDGRPENARNLACLGTHLKEIGRSADAGPFYERAVVAAREAIRLRPDDANANEHLGLALAGQGKQDEALAAFREALRLRPHDANAHNNLGTALHDQGKVAEAVAEYREVIRLRPDLAGAHNNLGFALRRQGKVAEAVTEYREAIRLRPDDANAHNNLGLTIYGQGMVAEAIAEYREAIRLRPDYAEPHSNLGTALSDQGNAAEAVGEYREAIRLRPDLADAHNNLGFALRRQGKVAEAVGEYREAIRLRPDYPEARYNLGLAFYGQERMPEAVAAFREAIRLRPDYPEAHYNLGLAVYGQGKMPEAVAAFREAIRLRPDYPEAHYSLGLTVYGQGKVAEAVGEYREAIRLRPDHPEAHCNLGLILRSQGDYAGALAMLRRGHELGTRQPGWRYPSAQWFAETERLAALAARLPALLKGEDRPRDITERLTLAQMCYDTKRFAAAARLWSEALAADAGLGDDRRAQHRYNAACAAALAASGQVADDPKFDDDARARLRGQALDWLKAERAAWTKVLDSGGAQARPLVQQTLRHWQADTDLAGVRDAEALAKLPESERVAWQSFWAEVDVLLARARGGRP